ncbi:unnamed protein product [Hymenolepis diminuta]|uniref:Uncharacterized protein n=1 Tax=Hymenolepis diminuta TaxID=6216 RepID=A0A564YWU6_HYMDI|nr:unnamed protein product [Hymenolepis diminuta]
MFLYDVPHKLSMRLYDNLKFAILESTEKPRLKFSKWLHNELMNRDTAGLWPQERDNSDPDPPQRDSSHQINGI